MIDKAKQFIYQRHAGQFRKGKNEPFTNHLEEAFEIAKTLTEDEDILVATYLHDVVEDTKTKISEIETLFGSRVAHYVALESEDKRKDRPETETWKIRKEETLDLLRNTTDRNLFIIVLADKLANTNEMVRDYKLVGSDLWGRFNSSYDQIGWYYQSMADVIKPHLGESEAFKQLQDNIDFLFK